MKTVWKAFTGNKEKGHKVAYLKLADNGALLAVGKEYIILNRAQIADLILTLDKVVYGAVLKSDVKRMEERVKEYREKRARQAGEPIVPEQIDLTAE